MYKVKLKLFINPPESGLAAFDSLSEELSQRGILDEPGIEWSDSDKGYWIDTKVQAINQAEADKFAHSEVLESAKIAIQDFISIRVDIIK
jgi:hypothetical protein